MSRVLIVEDEEHIALGLRFNLENTGYDVEVARTGKEALEAVGRGDVDIVILDVMLPGDKDGYAIAREIRRAQSFIPILMLTARDTLEDRVQGLEAGADDYLTKPFDLDELVARLRGMLRRQAWVRREVAARPADTGPDEIVFGDNRIDLRTYRATTHDGHEVELTAKEAEMMRLFARREGNAIARSVFLEEVWNEPGTLETRTVDNFVLKLRRYFEPDPKHPRHILSVRGVGYRFVR